MRQIKAWFGWHERARSGPAARALDGSRAIGCQKSCPLCQKANKTNVLSPRPLARRPLAANCCAVDGGGPESCNAPTGGVLEGVCLRLDLGEQRGIARSRRLAPLGLTLFERNIPSEDKTLVPAVPSRNPELLARAPSRGASRTALCTYPRLRRERYSCDPAVAFKIEANRGRYERQ